MKNCSTYLAEKGGEVGATTGRPRRCGWLDAFLLSHAVKLNGIDGLCITKIDVLDGLETIKVCTDYSSDISNPELIEMRRRLSSKDKREQAISIDKEEQKLEVAKDKGDDNV